MQSILINPKITKDKIISFKEFKRLSKTNEYIIYSDNVLEGITLLNDLTLDSEYLDLYGVVYDKIDQPIYIFNDVDSNKYAIKICGAYDKWRIPKEVANIINYIDLPDYVIYSVKNKKVILAGENTETASVGNSQWQREGRKLGAAVGKVPFIYQTFYSGRDESLNKIREPSCLQVFNQIIYSIRYKIPSFVAYFENNFEHSQTRQRNPSDSKILFIHYIKAILIRSINPKFRSVLKQLEKDFFIHMINYLKEPKYSDLLKQKTNPRLYTDLSCLSEHFFDKMLNNTENFAAEIVEYLHTTDQNQINSFLKGNDLLNFNENKFSLWNSYTNKANISDLLIYLKKNGKPSKTYTKYNAKVGVGDAVLVKKFLINKFHDKKTEIEKIINTNKYKEVVLLPLRINKKSNGKLTFSPDPESGEIVAFSELFSKNIKNKKCRPVIGYCIVNTPLNFNILSKKGTKLYKALAHYVDLLVINNSKLYTNFENDYQYDDYFPTNILDENPLKLTEEMSVVSTYLNQSTINGKWKLCFIHTHHSSWQQLIIYKDAREIQEKVDRISTKVDLIMEDTNKFMISEGKNDFLDILHDDKIKKAMKLASKKIDELYDAANTQFDSFIYNLHTLPNRDPDFYVDNETQKVCGAIERGHFNNIAYHKDFVIIIVYTNNNNKTAFKLIYSNNFNKAIKKQLNKEFNQ